MNTCPKCFNELAGNQHSNCELGDYLDKLSSLPQASVMLAGLTSHGKTAILESLLGALKKLSGRLSGFSINGIDQETIEMLRQIPADRIPDPTDGVTKALVNAYGLPIPGMNISERRHLFFYDPAGENFAIGRENATGLGPMMDSNVIWLVFNISNFVKDGARTQINEVLQSLTRMFQVEGKSLQGKNLIVVYTNGDNLVDFLPDDDKAEISRYLFEDRNFGQEVLDASPSASLNIDFGPYMSDAEKVSDLLERMTKDLQGGENFLQQARDLKLKLRFCVTESIGHPVDDGQQHGDRIPKRILDPLWWTLFQQRDQVPNQTSSSRRIVNLIVDANQNELFEKGWVEKLWKTLGDSYRTNVYFLGRKQAESLHPIAPPEIGSDTYAGLLGPLLSAMPREDLVVLLADQRVPIDFEDFRDDEEAIARIVLASINHELKDECDNTVILRSENDLPAVCTRLKSLSY